MTGSAERDWPGTPLGVAILGADREALALLPTLLADPGATLLGMMPRHPEDLIHHLGHYGYRLAEPCPVPLLPGFEALAELDGLDLIIDASGDPGAARHLAEAGLAATPTVNPAAAIHLLARHTPRLEPNSPADTPPDQPDQPDQAAAMPVAEPFRERLAREVGRAYRHGRTVGVVLLRFPPEAFEKPKRAARVVSALERSLRLEDAVGPVENGTLALLLPETGKAVRKVASRLTSTLADLRIREGKGAPCQAVGWAWFPHDGKTAPALLEAARTRMDAPAPQSN